MKKIISIFLSLAIATNAQATSITMPYCTKAAGDTIKSSEWNSNCTTVQSFLNNQNLDGTTNIAAGGIQTANLANLSVTDGKIAGITTAGKVNGSAIVGINNLPVGAGTLPMANFQSPANFPGSATFAGNVGVFQVSPGTALDVNGTIRATSFSGPMVGTVTTGLSYGTVYAATLDGYASCSVTNGAVSDVIIKSDSGNPPTTGLAECGCPAVANARGSGGAMIKKGNNYEFVDASGTSVATFTNFTPINK